MPYSSKEAIHAFFHTIPDTSALHSQLTLLFVCHKTYGAMDVVVLFGVEYRNGDCDVETGILQKIRYEITKFSTEVAINASEKHHGKHTVNHVSGDEKCPPPKRLKKSDIVNDLQAKTSIPYSDD
ncbi:unnamed protein product [Oppiella nova]|uniref:Uncharacterized protein n=1 Tax=Oppiella nova TaxID=334625 RepID=A0A7R9Q8R9_9ACAR|nr:unnamed protein product [Oppiella nova]CAG2158501.1 unnamed protein product [Oppiella nova]